MATTTTATKATEGTLSDVSDVPVQYRVIHGHRRAFRMLGTGPALLLLHGIGDSGQTWVPLMRRLARRYTVLAPDLLGHGASDKPRADYSVAAYANGMRDLLEHLAAKATPLANWSPSSSTSTCPSGLRRSSRPVPECSIRSAVQ